MPIYVYEAQCVRVLYIHAESISASIWFDSCRMNTHFYGFFFRFSRLFSEGLNQIHCIKSHTYLRCMRFFYSDHHRALIHLSLTSSIFLFSFTITSCDFIFFSWHSFSSTSIFFWIKIFFFHSKYVHIFSRFVVVVVVARNWKYVYMTFLPPILLDINVWCDNILSSI